MNLINYSIISSIGLALLSQALLANPGPKTDPAAISVGWRNERLDVVANHAALSEVMLAVAGKTGLEIHGLPYLKGDIQTKITQQPLAFALKELLQHASYLLQESPGKNNSHPVLTVLSFNDPNVKHQSDKPVPDGSTETVKIPASAGYVPKEFHKLYGYAQKGDILSLKKVIETGESTAQAIATKLLAQLDPALTSELAAETAKSADPNRRLNAIQALSELDNADAASALGTALNDADIGVRSAAILGLHNQTSNKAITYLTEALQDEESSIRLLALDLLAEKGTDGVAGINAAMASNDPQLREHAQELLDQILPGESN